MGVRGRLGWSALVLISTSLAGRGAYFRRGLIHPPNPANEDVGLGCSFFADDAVHRAIDFVRAEYAHLGSAAISPEAYGATHSRALRPSSPW
jgi:hypothetical protein